MVELIYMLISLKTSGPPMDILGVHCSHRSSVQMPALYKLNTAVPQPLSRSGSIDSLSASSLHINQADWFTSQLSSHDITHQVLLSPSGSIAIFPPILHRQHLEQSYHPLTRATSTVPSKSIMQSCVNWMHGWKCL